MSEVIDWARHHTASTIWSCLAAHAAVLQSDGIKRRAFKQKLSGLFECRPVAPHPMLRGAPLPLRVPHSRLNDLPEAVLRANGYRVLSRSAAGADTFVKEPDGGSLFVFADGSVHFIRSIPGDTPTGYTPNSLAFQAMGTRANGDSIQGLDY